MSVSATVGFNNTASIDQPSEGSINPFHFPSVVGAKRFAFKWETCAPPWIDDPAYNDVVAAGKRPFFPRYLDHNPQQCRVHCFYIHTAKGVHRIAVNQVGAIKICGKTKNTMTLNGNILDEFKGVEKGGVNRPDMVQFKIEGHSVRVFYGQTNITLHMACCFLYFQPTRLTVCVDGVTTDGEWDPMRYNTRNQLMILLCAIPIIFWWFLLSATCFMCLYCCGMACFAKMWYKATHYDAERRCKIDLVAAAGPVEPYVHRSPFPPGVITAYVPGEETEFHRVPGPRLVPTPPMTADIM